MKPSERIQQLANEVINLRPGTTPAEAIAAGIVAYLNEQHRPCECYACQEREEQRQAGER